MDMATYKQRAEEAFGKGVTLYKPFMQPRRGKYHIRDKKMRGLCGCEISLVDVSHTHIRYREDCDNDICKRCFNKWWSMNQGRSDDGHEDGEN